MRQSNIIVQLCVCCVFYIPLVRCEIDSNGMCRLVTFTPFTTGGTENRHHSGTVHNNLGFSHLSSAVLAMEQFNARDSSVVPELNTSFMETCSIQFDTNSSRFYDSEGIGKMALKQIQQSIMRDGRPCAIAGPYNDEPIRDLSTVATGIDVPIVSHRGTDVEFSYTKSYPMLSQTYPATVFRVWALISLLVDRGRDDFVAILYALDDISLQTQTGMADAFQRVGIRSKSFGYLNSDTDVPPIPGTSVESSSLEFSLQQIKDSDFRTIVIISDSFFLDSSLPNIATAADVNGLTDGDHFWCFFEGLELGYVADLKIRDDPVVSKLLRGAALLMPVESFLATPSEDKFLASWMEQDGAFLDRVKALNPIEEGMPGFYSAEEDYFESVDPEAGAGFLYDAVMSIGIGACHAQLSSLSGEGEAISGVDHVIGIQSVDFQGASGRVILEPSEGFSGTRDSSHALYGVFNLLPPNDNDGKGYVLSEVLDPAGSDTGFNNPWVRVNDFVYADGRTVAPANFVPEQNHLNPSVQIFGFCLFSIAALLILMSASWIIINRKHRILAASQPQFLLMICFGSMVLNMAIISFSFDDSNGWSTQRLSTACVVGPWLAFIGYVICYGGLFCKLWRINKVLQFARAQVNISHVIWPLGIMALVTIVVLAIWTALADFGWQREEVDELTGESFGHCTGDNLGLWLFPAILIIFVATALTFMMAWKTKDVDSAYSEAKWVFILILVQMQTLFFCIPLVVILSGLSTNGKYIGFTLMIWTFPMTNMTLIMLPKVVAFYSNDPSGNTRQRGASTGVAVSGIQDPSNRSASKLSARASKLSA